MTIKEIYPNIHHIKFKNQYEETMTLIRLQEFYESPFPEIRGNHFTLEEYMDRYAKFKGNFTYCTDWSGFNVPGNVVLKFKDLFMDSAWDFRTKECKLIHTLEEKVKNFDTGKFYLICTYKDEDIFHELAHGLFYLKKTYRKRMCDLVDFKNHKFKKIKNELLKMGYDKSVIVDEIQAYIATDTYESNIIDIEVTKKFKKIFKQYTKGLK